MVIDPDGVYDPRLVNDRLLLGLKGTMSEYELSLLRQRGLAARDSKADRGALRFTLPPGSAGARTGASRWIRTSGCRGDPARLRQVPGARQRAAGLPVGARCRPAAARRRAQRIVRRIEWRKPAYHSMVQVLHNPLYAGAYAFGRHGERTTRLSTAAP